MIREIDSSIIEETVYSLFSKACMSPPENVIDMLRNAYKTETSSVGKSVLSNLVRNSEISKKTNVPYCQDTGMAVLFIEIGQDVHVNGDINRAVNRGVRFSYEKNYFRKSVADPLTRLNTGDNTPAIIHYFLTEGDKIRISALPKGFGSENMSKLKLFPASAGKEEIAGFVLDCVIQASSNPCPPVFLGIGIGGDFEYCALLSKRALLRNPGEQSPDPEVRELEERILRDVNALGFGPMGTGGSNYCLGVNILTYPTHITSLPVAVNFCCHALRHETAVI